MTQTMVQPAPTDDNPEPPDRPGRSDTPMTTATRYLCAGAYLDDTFRDRSLREVYHQHKRFVAPSHGFDLVTVLQACLRARNQTICRDAAIIATLATAAYLNWLSVALVGTALVCLRVTTAAWRLAREFLARARSGQAIDTTKSPRRGLALLFGWAATVIVLVVLAGKGVSVVASSATGVRSVGIGGALLLTVVVID